ncbi:hypothetical protein [Limihaloglobus sulfuriphilus]|nr:hypothetical protein [Limihaloglobus sulfuriphilus]
MFVIAGAGLLLSALMQLDDINAMRKELKLISTDKPLENAPPSLAFATVAMGAFRGLVVDILWMRADRLKEEGQFFDAKQIAEWITVLQPRFASVWDFHAWNMAYNISVAIPSSRPEERWHWVKNGFELLRDKGIEYNPNAIILYRSLAWIFQHKMSGVTDDVHKYYKLRLIMEMGPLVQPLTNAHFDSLAAAPKTFEQLRANETLAEFADKLKAADEKLADEEKFPLEFLRLFNKEQGFSEEAVLLMQDYEQSDALIAMRDFSQAWELRNTWKFDIDLMIKLNEKYGPITFEEGVREPLNWEHPDAHAIYWAEKGLAQAGSEGVVGEDYSIDEINTDRIVFHSLQNLFRTGRLVVYDAVLPAEATESEIGAEDTVGAAKYGKSLYTVPDLRMFDSYNAAQIERIEKYSGEDGEAGSRSLYTGHRNMLTNAVLSFYQAGHVKKASQIYKDLRERYPRPENSVPIEVFCRQRIKEEFEGITIYDAMEACTTLLSEAYFRYAIYDDQEAMGKEQLARQVYDIYRTEDFEGERVTLPSFSRLRYIALINFMNDPYYPPNMSYALMQRLENERPEVFEKLTEENETFMQEYQKMQEQQQQQGQQ